MPSTWELDPASDVCLVEGAKRSAMKPSQPAQLANAIA
jgi:hypothetical protein